MLEAANASVSDWRYTSKSLFRSPRDLIRLLFGLGTNGSGCLIILLGLTGTELTVLCSDKLGPIRLNSNDVDALCLKSSLGILGVGGLTWLFGLYHTVKGWNMSNAYSKLSKAREIQKIIDDIEIEKNKELEEKS